ncbi:MAG: hypothetical protein ACLUD2_07675 [Clostridium sp.]
MEDGKTVRTTKIRQIYKKIFDAIDTANHDKWDDAAPTYTSWRPVGNAVNRSEDTIWNTRASDRVRQFAITWYLDDVAAKFIQADGNSISGETAFSDEILDRAMREAMVKAQNYLKPFFAYDLDALYAIAWDEAPGGGADGDPATLSVDVRIRLMKRFLNIMGSQQCFHTERMWWWSSSQRMPGLRTLKTDIMKQTSQRKSNFQQFMRMRRARRRPLEFWIRFIDTRLLLKRRNWNGATRIRFLEESRRTSGSWQPRGL